MATIVAGLLLGFTGYFKHFERHNPALLHTLREEAQRVPDDEVSTWCGEVAQVAALERRAQVARDERRALRAPASPPTSRAVRNPNVAPAMMSGARSPTIHDASRS